MKLPIKLHGVNDWTFKHVRCQDCMRSRYHEILEVIECCGYALVINAINWWALILYAAMRFARSILYAFVCPSWFYWRYGCYDDPAHYYYCSMDFRSLRSLLRLCLYTVMISWLGSLLAIKFLSLFWLRGFRCYDFMRLAAMIKFEVLNSWDYVMRFPWWFAYCIFLQVRDWWWFL